YLAVKKKGSEGESRPMRFRSSRNDEDPPDWVADDERDFWVPVHKLFPGKECLNGVNVKDVAFDVSIANEKLFRTHKKGLGETPPAAPPFRITSGIAELSENADDGAGVLVPLPHPLVEEAREGLKPNGKFVTFTVPKGKNAEEFDTFRPDSPEAPNALP